MFSEMWFIWIWAQANSFTPFKWTITVSGITPSTGVMRDVVAEATLSKVKINQFQAHAKASVWGATTAGGSQVGPFGNVGQTVVWGIDGAPIRSISKAGTVTFALEVMGQATFAAMVGKLYIY